MSTSRLVSVRPHDDLQLRGSTFCECALGIETSRRSSFCETQSATLRAFDQAVERQIALSLADGLGRFDGVMLNRILRARYQRNSRTQVGQGTQFVEDQVRQTEESLAAQPSQANEFSEIL